MLMKKVIALLTMLFCTIAISNIKAQTVLEFPKEHDADMCLGFLGNFILVRRLQNQLLVSSKSYF